MTPIELLDKTERLIRAHGWGQLKSPGCLLNRMYEAAGLQFGRAVEREHNTLRQAANAVRRFLGAPHLTLWNDVPNRTIEQVFAAIDGARKLLGVLPPPP